MAQVRTFHPRRGRLSGRHHDALAALWPLFGFPWPETALTRTDLAARFGRTAGMVLEIGSGMGDATASMAAADRDRDYLAVDVHTPGVANLLAVIEERGLTNVRVARGDALELVALLPAGVLQAVHAFFPDPWPKARHHKRRLVQPSHTRLLASRLAIGGTLHCATDWPPYAESMLATLTAEPLLRNEFGGFAPRPADRPLTKFEERGLAAGRPIHDLIFRRVTAP
jgi:tRNA (guanine-N7-)-methyltransferase